MGCDMCGADKELYKTRIEGTLIHVCANCAKHGQVLGKVESPVISTQKKVFEEQDKIEMLVPGFGAMIRKEREKQGLDQEKFALKLNEKKSIVHKIENEEMEPSIPLARKLERLLNINLIEEYEGGEEAAVSKSESKDMTIGDMIKIKTRKKG